LHISRSQRVARAAGERGDGDGVVGCDADIHALKLDPLWRLCKRDVQVLA
jgi:hypothetical protein